MTEITDIHGGIHRIDFDNLESAYINCDCMEALRKMPDKCVDLAICDPPYGINIHKMNYTQSGAKTIGKATRRDYSNIGTWDSAAPDDDYFCEIMRVSKNQIIWGGNYFADKLPPSKSYVIWDKRTEDKYQNDFADCEYAWCSNELGVARICRYMWCGMLQGNMKNKESRFHPTQKPVALYEWLLSRYAKEGDVILDTHVGSASSLIACYRTNHKFIGFELDEYYYKKSKERLEAEMAQMRLYDFMEV